MLKKRFATALALFLVLPALAFAGGGNTNTCDTRYPVILAHGAGITAEIFGIIDAWWGIEDALEDEGAEVYVTAVNSMDGTVAKAQDWKRQSLEILAVTGSSKVNVISHSHGALYTRYAISNLGLGAKTRSHTSLCGPHRGMELADVIVHNLPSGLWSLAGAVMDMTYAMLMGDDDPDTAQMGYDLCTDYMTGVFNPNTPNVSGVYYQSWAAKAKYACSSVFLEPTWLILLALEGANDGLVSVKSAKWGKFRGTESGSWWSPGVDHANMVGHLFGVTPGFDAPGFYVDFVSELKDKGY